MSVVYSKNPDVVFRKIAGECILVPIKNRIGDMEAIYTLNEVAARAWELVDGRRSLEAIGAEIGSEFDVPPEVAAADLSELFYQLERAGTVIEAKNEPS
jgi:hypothetical protein